MDTWALNMVKNSSRRAAEASRAVELMANDVVTVGNLIGEALVNGKKILVCGNGGSAACAQHFAAEFTGKLALDRRPLAAISLGVDTSALTAIANDYHFDEIFSRQVSALGAPGDILVGISTSGRSENVRRAMETAKEGMLTTVALTGAPSTFSADFELVCPVAETARAQEAHDLILHSLAQISERIAVPGLQNDASADRFPFVLTEKDLSDYAEWLAHSGQTIATTNGVFDLLHEGHRDSLRSARREADRLVVLVNSDASVRRLKGPARPIQSIASRVRGLADIPECSHVVVFDEDTPARVLAMLKPSVHCKGQDYAGRDLDERDVVEKNGGRIVLLPLVPGVSTTSLVSARHK